jgi:hypothetical protein
MKLNYAKNVNKIVKHAHHRILRLVYHVILILFLRTNLVRDVAVNAYNVLLEVKTNAYLVALGKH